MNNSMKRSKSKSKVKRRTHTTHILSFSRVANGQSATTIKKVYNNNNKNNIEEEEEGKSYEI